MGLRQGRRRVLEYAVEFRTLAADSSWNNSSLCDVYLHGLTDVLRDQLASLELPEDLDSLISLPMKIGKRLFERERERSRPVTPFSQRGQAAAASSSWRSPPYVLQAARSSLPPRPPPRTYAAGEN